MPSLCFFFVVVAVEPGEYDREREIYIEKERQRGLTIPSLQVGYPTRGERGRKNKKEKGETV